MVEINGTAKYLARACCAELVSKIAREIAADIGFLSGVGCIATAGFMISTPLGLVVIGLPLVVWSVIAGKNAGKKATAENDS